MLSNNRIRLVVIPQRNVCDKTVKLALAQHLYVAPPLQSATSRELSVFLVLNFSTAFVFETAINIIIAKHFFSLFYAVIYFP